MSTQKTECNCSCHFGEKVNHWQFGQSMKYEPAPCSCAIQGNPNYVEPEIRKLWEDSP